MGSTCSAERNSVAPQSGVHDAHRGPPPHVFNTNGAAVADEEEDLPTAKLHVKPMDSLAYNRKHLKKKGVDLDSDTGVELNEMGKHMNASANAFAEETEEDYANETDDEDEDTNAKKITQNKTVLLETDSNKETNTNVDEEGAPMKHVTYTKPQETAEQNVEPVEPVTYTQPQETAEQVTYTEPHATVEPVTYTQPQASTEKNTYTPPKDTTSLEYETTAVGDAIKDADTLLKDATTLIDDIASYEECMANTTLVEPMNDHQGQADTTAATTADELDTSTSPVNDYAGQDSTINDYAGQDSTANDYAGQDSPANDYAGRESTDVNSAVADEKTDVENYTAQETDYAEQDSTNVNPAVADEKTVVENYTAQENEETTTPLEGVTPLESKTTPVKESTEEPAATSDYVETSTTLVEPINEYVGEVNQGTDYTAAGAGAPDEETAVESYVQEQDAQVTTAPLETVDTAEVTIPDEKKDESTEQTNEEGNESTAAEEEKKEVWNM